jgi:hypothetical protein
VIRARSPNVLGRTTISPAFAKLFKDTTNAGSLLKLNRIMCNNASKSELSELSEVR